MKDIGRTVELSDGRKGIIRRYCFSSPSGGKVLADVEIDGKWETHVFPSQQAFTQSLEGTWKVIEYAGPMNKDHVFEFDSFEEALERLRCGYPYFIKMEKPDGTHFEPQGEEWNIHPVYNMLVLRKGPFSASQNWIINRLLEKPNSRHLYRFVLIGFPFHVPNKHSEREIHETVFELLANDILELVPGDYTGPLQPEHRDLVFGYQHQHKESPRSLMNRFKNEG